MKKGCGIALASLLGLTSLSIGQRGLIPTAAAQSADPYISGIDDRPAARLRRNRETARDTALGDFGFSFQPKPQLPVQALEHPLVPEMVVIRPGQFLMGSPKECQLLVM